MQVLVSGANLVGVEPLGHGPGGDDVVHDALAQRLGHLVQLHELAHVVEHVVVLGGGRRHLLDDGGHVPEDRGVQERCDTPRGHAPPRARTQLMLLSHH